LPELSIEQDGRLVTTVTKDRGLATVSAMPFDPDAIDSHAFAWSVSDNALVPQEGNSQSTFTFDPSALAEGVYRIAVDVVDNGAPAQSARQYRYLRIIATSPSLVAGEDRDGDGMQDIDEELRGSNGNGTSDYLDPGFARHHVVAKTGSGALLQAADGYTLSLGRVALTTGDDAMVSMMDIVDYGDDGAAANAGLDQRFNYPAGIFDVELRGLPQPGHSVLVVIPQSATIPPDAVYRTFIDGQQWINFTTNADNGIYSAPGDPGVCPAPGSAAYSPGLGAGDYCVQLLLQDGGPNDADGEADGVFKAPGGVAVNAKLATVGAISHAVPDRTVSAGSSNVVMLRFSLNSNTSDVELNELTLRASGTGNDAGDIRSVKVWVDLNANGDIDAGEPQIGTGNFATDNAELVLHMTAPYRMDAGNTGFIVSYDC
jgi:hypothetical protein